MKIFGLRSEWLFTRVGVAASILFCAGLVWLSSSYSSEAPIRLVGQSADAELSPAIESSSAPEESTRAKLENPESSLSQTDMIKHLSVIRQTHIGDIEKIKPHFEILSAAPEQLRQIYSQSLQSDDQILAIQLSYAYRGSDAALRRQAADTAAEVIDRGSRDQRLLAIECAGLVGENSANLTSMLVLAGVDRDARVRYRTAAAIGRLQEPSAKLHDLLEILTKDSSPTVAARAGGILGPSSQGANHHVLMKKSEKL